MKKKKLARGKFVAPELGEWFMGLPRSWTSPVRTAKAEHTPKAPGRFENASLFSGIGGLELCTHDAFRTTLFAECGDGAKKVLERRMQDGHLDMGRMADQVENLTEADLKDKKAITAGLPMP